MSEPRAPDAARAAPTADHRNADGTFRNPWPDSGAHGLSDVLRWMRERRRTGRAPTPPRNSFPSSTSEVVHPRAARETARATWVGHSTVLLQVGGLNVLTDPMWSERASPVQWAGPRRIMAPALPLESLPPLDLVLLSHSHYDHLDKGTVKRLAHRHPDAQWMAPLGLGRYLRRFGVRKVSELDWWQRVSHRGATVTATPARHFSARRLGDRNRTLWCGYAVEIHGRRIYFAGDTAYHPAFREIAARCGPFDFVMMPIGAYDPRWFMRVVHVDPVEAVQACADLRSAHPGHDMPVVLGIHWGTFRLTDEPMDEPPRRTTELWCERGFFADRLWIARFGETRAW